MHLPDHYLDPMTSTVTALISGGAVTYALVRMRRDPRAQVVPVAATGAVIFAAQMVNFPIAGGTSGHLVGGALAGILLGPWAGMVAMAAVLAVQAFIFGDGGVAALGANILNMGVIGVSVGAACRAVPLIWRKSSEPTQVELGKPYLPNAIAAAIAGWLSVVLAALACALEMTASGAAAVTEVVPAMVGLHALIGLPEAAITALAVSLVAYVPSQATALSNRLGQLGLISAAIIAITLAPFASSLPDGLERVAEGLVSSTNTTAALPSLFSDYAVPGIASAFTATALACLLGAVAVYSLIRLAYIGLRPPQSISN